jgi:hypothetical protein
VPSSPNTFTATYKYPVANHVIINKIIFHKEYVNLILCEGYNHETIVNQWYAFSAVQEVRKKQKLFITQVKNKMPIQVNNSVLHF